MWWCPLLTKVRRLAMVKPSSIVLITVSYIRSKRVHRQMFTSYVCMWLFMNIYTHTYLTLHYLTLPYLTSPYLTLHYIHTLIIVYTYMQLCGIYIHFCAYVHLLEWPVTRGIQSHPTWATQFGRQRATGLLHGRGAVQKRPRPPGSVSKVAMGNPHWKFII
jgi:hypothetical protein